MTDTDRPSPGEPTGPTRPTETTEATGATGPSETTAARPRPHPAALPYLDAAAPSYPAAPAYPGTPSYPAEPAYPAPPYPASPYPAAAYPSYAYGSGHYPYPVVPTKSVAGLGIAVQVLLAVQFLAVVIMLFPAFHERSVIRRIADGQAVSLTEAHHADTTLNAVSLITLIMYAATGIVWIVWLYRARTNVESWNPQYQRRSPGWAIGGWFCPIVNFWFPYQVVKDSWDDTEQDRTGWRKGHPVVIVWWLGYVLLVVARYTLGRATPGDDATVDDYTGYADRTIGLTILTAVAIVPAVFVVRGLTAAQTARREREAAAVTQAFGG